MEMPPSGVKRKHETFEDGVAIQRQSILDISRCKLQQRMSRHEPSLRRSVLIFNTLRHIERELRREGVMLNPAQAASLLPTLAPTSDATLDPPPSPMPDACPSGETPTGYTSPPHSGVLPSRNAYIRDREWHDGMDNHLIHHMVSHEEPAAARLQDNSKTCLSSYSSCPSISSSITHHQHSMNTDSLDTWFFDSKSSSSSSSSSSLSGDRVTSGTFSSLFDLDTGMTSPSTEPIVDVAGAAAASIAVGRAMCMSTSTSLISPSGSLQHQDQMFAHQGSNSPCLADLDLPVLDLDLFSSHVSGKLPSLSAEELTSSLPPCGEPFGTFNANYCNPKHELLSDDLDHIMQVLVGI